MAEASRRAAQSSRRSCTTRPRVRSSCPTVNGDVDAPEISRWPSRVAHAWDQQNLRLMFSDVDVSKPRMMLHRDVHDRLRMLTPFFWQSAHVTPIAWRDTLYWAIHLYSATDYYPLSEHTHLGGEDVSYVRHAATAIVHAQSGHVTFVADSVLRPHCGDVGTAVSDAVLELELVARGSSRERSAARSKVPWHKPPRTHALDRVRSRHPSPAPHCPGRSVATRSLFGGAYRPLYLTPIDSRLAWTTPLLDAGDRVKGIIISVGGAQPVTYWYPLSEPWVRWPAVLERLMRVPETPAASTRRHAATGSGSYRPDSWRYGRVSSDHLRMANTTARRQSLEWRRMAAAPRETPSRSVSRLPKPSACGRKPPKRMPSTITPAVFRQRVNDLYAAHARCLATRRLDRIRQGVR